MQYRILFISRFSQSNSCKWIRVNSLHLTLLKSALMLFFYSLRVLCVQASRQKLCLNFHISSSWSHIERGPQGCVCLIVFDLETLTMRRPRPALDCFHRKKKSVMHSLSCSYHKQTYNSTALISAIVNKDYLFLRLHGVLEYKFFTHFNFSSH
jgi:hypothetical protein